MGNHTHLVPTFNLPLTPEMQANARLTLLFWWVKRHSPHNHQSTEKHFCKKKKKNMLENNQSSYATHISSIIHLNDFIQTRLKDLHGAYKPHSCWGSEESRASESCVPNRTVLAKSLFEAILLNSQYSGCDSHKLLLLKEIQARCQSFSSKMCSGVLSSLLSR